MSNDNSYLLAGTTVELDRLRLQAKVFERPAEAWFDEVGIQPGWRCLDLGCGALGVIGPLARRVGSNRRVVGVDIDQKLLDAASAFVAESGLANIELVRADAYATGLPAETFDFARANVVSVVFPVGIFIAWADDRAISPSEVKQRFDIGPMHADVTAIPPAGACNTVAHDCLGFSGAATGSTNTFTRIPPIAPIRRRRSEQLD